MKNPKADAFLAQEKRWKKEFEALRELVLTTGLDEHYKWMHPCYALDGGNVVIIHGFKEYCALLFLKGALMKDPKKILIQQTANVQSARQIRFKTLDEIVALKPVLTKYLEDAIAVEKSGAKVPMKKTSEYPVVPELKARFDAEPAFKAAFERLTPGRQRGYLYFFSAAKQSKTREARIEKYADRILDGLGIDD
jgi:uncharacterized protein YdeI (YjbR/CyaY-like superfamily)